MKTLPSILSVVVLVALLPIMSGCRDVMPHSATWPYSGDLVPSHPEPPDSGYYTNWDPYATTLEVTPVTDVNPVRTQHVFIATVLDEEGNPLPNRRVEWIIAQGSVGDIIEVDESGLRASRGYIVDNQRAVSHTNNYEHVLTRGNDDPSDDIHLGVGQTWCVVTSPVEGTTHMIAYAPGIYDWDEHKVFVTKHWLDFDYQLPADATNRIGETHEMGTHVFQNSSGQPLAGYEVTYTILSGPDATLSPGGGQSVTVLTDADGMADVSLDQVTPQAGQNVVGIQVVRPAQDGQEALILVEGEMTKTWLAPDIAIVKTGPASALVGDTLTYELHVSNPGEVSAENVVVTDSLPAGLTFVDAAPAAQARGQELTWQLGSLGAGESRMLTVMATADRTGTFVNPAAVRADDGLTANAQATTTIGAAALAVTKNAPAEVMLCEMIDYEIIITNTGNADATNVVLDEALPDGLLTENGNRRITSRMDVLPAGESRTVRFRAQAQRTGTFNNTVTVNADRGLSASDSASTVVRQPILEVTKMAPATRFLNQSVTYTITVENTGDAPARNTMLVDDLPAGVTFVSADHGGQARGGHVNWDLGTLNPGDSVTVEAVVRANHLGTLTNSATARADCAEDSAVATTEIVGIPALLLECIDVSDPIAVGDEETYVITVTNQGTAMATDLIIECTVPDEARFVSATGPTADSVNGQVVRFATLDELAPHDSATFRVTVVGTSAGDARFMVTLDAAEIDDDNPVRETESTRFYNND
jgi:uncharacterized repeat protein (TIGR01451 family)